MGNPYFTVCIPAYNCGAIIGETLTSLIHQTFADWECLVVDDGSTDDTETAVQKFGDPRIRFIRNRENLGYPGNLRRCFDLATGVCLYLLGNDDILSPVALERAYNAFQMAPDIAVVTRPYYWFETHSDEAIRYTKQFGLTADQIISPGGDDRAWLMIYSTLAQLSALAFKRAAIAGDVNPWVFPAHVQPWLATFKNYRGVFLKDYPVAIRKGSSQTRYVSAIYDPSPLWSWVDMFEQVFPGTKWKRPRLVGIDFVAKNVEGLVQIRCHSTFWIFVREVWLHAWYRPLNLLSPRYWFFALGCLLLPRQVLRRITDLLTPFFMRPRGSGITLARQNAT